MSSAFEELALFVGSLIPGRTLLIFDEVRRRAALNSLKYFHEHARNFTLLRRFCWA